MKLNRLTFLICTVAIVFLISTNVPLAQRGNAGIRRSIVTTNQEFMAAFARGDGAGIAALYTADGQLLQPNGDIISGRQAIARYWQGAIESGLRRMQLETVEVEGVGRMASEVGRYTVFGGEGQAIETGKYVVLWKREGSRWRLYRDIWNSNTPVREQ